MKRALLPAPFVLLTGLSLASKWVNGGHLLGNLWALAFVGCILTVPVLSRTRLWLGYAGLFYPFLVLGLHIALDWGSLNIGLG